MKDIKSKGSLQNICIPKPPKDVVRAKFDL